MKILITGAAGQIGSGLAKRLCDKHELTLVDNLRNGYAEHLKDDEDRFIAPFHDKNSFKMAWFLGIFIAVAEGYGLLLAKSLIRTL